MNNPRQHRSWTLGTRRRVAGAALALAIMLLPAVLATGSAQAQTFTTLHSFDGTDGKVPYAGLAQATDGNFYGTALEGGANSWGTVFQITPGGELTTLHSFDNTDGDGAYPYAGLIQATDGNFYGTTAAGGAGAYGNQGTIFKITPSGTLTTLYSFCSQSGCTDGRMPYGALVQATDGNFYGTTTAGGASDDGTVFTITPSGVLTTLHTFDGTDGAGPAGLIQATNGNFYGTTSSQGATPWGTVFEITPSGTLTTLHSFCSLSGCADGGIPEAALVQGTDGNFYGTASNFGVNGAGTIFKITPSGTLTTLYSFCSLSGCADGLNPEAALVQGTDGNLYGTTTAGGSGCADGCGTVFKITPSGVLTTLHSFDYADGANPVAGLVQATNGNFYGTTSEGGAYCSYGSCGTVFSLSVAAPAVTLSPTSLRFGNQALNETSAAKTVTLTNSGKATLTISDITIGGDFAISAKTCGATLAAGKKCKVSVTFTPAQLGSATGTLTITDDALNSPQTVPLSGKGVEPATLTPTKATYAKQKVGTTSAAKTFTLTNDQTVALTSIVISPSADFAISATTCTTSLAEKKKCTISVTFTPTETGKRTGQLSVSDSASNSPQTASLTGTGD